MSKKHKNAWDLKRFKEKLKKEYSREYLKKATEEYLKSGGTITKLTVQEPNFYDLTDYAHDFLRGE